MRINWGPNHKYEYERLCAQLPVECQINERMSFQPICVRYMFQQTGAHTNNIRHLPSAIYLFILTLYIRIHGLRVIMCVCVQKGKATKCCFVFIKFRTLYFIIYYTGFMCIQDGCAGRMIFCVMCVCI